MMLIFILHAEGMRQSQICDLQCVVTKVMIQPEHVMGVGEE